MTYWKDRKKDWDMLLNMWNIENSTLDQWLVPSISSDNDMAYTSKTKDKTIELSQLKVVRGDDKRDDKREKNSIKLVTSSPLKKVRVSPFNNRLTYYYKTSPYPFYRLLFMKNIIFYISLS